MRDAIYMDHHATTPVDARVVEAMLPTFRDVFGNASSRSHAFGRMARTAVEGARAEIAALVGSSDDEIVFTSGATESDGLAILGVAGRPGAHLITQATEHAAVLDACTAARARGACVTVLPVDRTGRVDVGAVEDAITGETALVSVMLANNEIGTAQDVRAIGAVARARGVLFHCDAAQGLGYLPFTVDDAGVDLLSVSGHKLYGPKGVGALYVRRAARSRVAPQVHGGGHEGGLRSGTLNVPGIVGLGRAAAILREEGASEAERLAVLRDRLWERLRARIPEVALNGPSLARGARHPGNLNVRFLHAPADALLLDLFDVLALSSGSACASEKPGPSHVLAAIGLVTDEARSSIRFGLGRETTADEVDRAVDLVADAVARARARSPLWEMYLRGETPDW